MVAQNFGPRIQKLFTDVCTFSPEVLQPAQLLGWLEIMRAKAMSSVQIGERSILLRRGEAYGELQGAVYQIAPPVIANITVIEFRQSKNELKENQYLNNRDSE